MVRASDDLAHGNVKLLAADLADGFDFYFNFLSFLYSFLLIDFLLFSFLKLIFSNIMLGKQKLAPLSKFSSFKKRTTKFIGN